VTTTKFTPATAAARALLNAASDPDPARAALIPAELAQLEQRIAQVLREGQRDAELLAKLQAEDPAAAAETARTAVAKLELDHAVAETETERKRLTSAIKAHRAQLEEAEQAHRTKGPQIQLLIERDAQRANLVGELKQQYQAALTSYRAAVSRLVAAELRAAVMGLQPLLQFAAAVASGAQAQAVTMALQELHVGNPANGQALLHGTKFADHLNTHRVPGVLTEFPTTSDLVEDWPDDSALMAARQLAAEPLKAMQALMGWRSIHQRAAEEAQRRAEEERDRTPKSLPRTKPADPPAQPAAAAPEPAPGFKPFRNNPLTRPGGRMVNGQIEYPGVEQLDAEMGHQLLRDPLDGSPYAGN
jgi:hypothetical protein